jgi:enamine deaminase RidA (YjgF/YER057c/UK114 family)
MVFISGQVTVGPKGLEYVGQVGKEISEADAKKAARLCGLNLIAQLKAACDGDLDRVVRCVKLTAFVNAVPGFGNHPEVANGASDLMVEVFGDAGKHTRAAVGSGSLPRNVSVEVDAVFEIK